MSNFTLTARWTISPTSTLCPRCKQWNENVLADPYAHRPSFGEFCTWTSDSYFFPPDDEYNRSGEHTPWVCRDCDTWWITPTSTTKRYIPVALVNGILQELR